jgi:hypothetical protein
MIYYVSATLILTASLRNCRQRPDQVKNTGYRPITEVKQRWAWLVLGWVTSWEHRVLLAAPIFARRSSLHKLKSVHVKEHLATMGAAIVGP